MMSANGKLTASAEIEVVRIEQGRDPKVVVCIADVIDESGLRLRRPRTGETTVLRVGQSYRVQIDLDVPATATGEQS